MVKSLRAEKLGGYAFEPLPSGHQIPRKGPAGHHPSLALLSPSFKVGRHPVVNHNTQKIPYPSLHSNPPQKKPQPQALHPTLYPTGLPDKSAQPSALARAWHVSHRSPTRHRQGAANLFMLLSNHIPLFSLTPHKTVFRIQEKRGRSAKIPETWLTSGGSNACLLLVFLSSF